MRREDWFNIVGQVCPMWARKNENTLIASFNGYKGVVYFEASSALRAAGGLVMSADFDPICGRTFIEIREPKNLEKETV